MGDNKSDTSNKATDEPTNNATLATFLAEDNGAELGGGVVGAGANPLPGASPEGDKLTPVTAHNNPPSAPMSSRLRKWNLFKGWYKRIYGSKVPPSPLGVVKGPDPLYEPTNWKFVHGDHTVDPINLVNFFDTYTILIEKAKNNQFTKPQFMVQLALLETRSPLSLE